jgi:hypothetical protein
MTKGEIVTPCPRRGRFPLAAFGVWLTVGVA